MLGDALWELLIVISNNILIRFDELFQPSGRNLRVRLDSRAVARREELVLEVLAIDVEYDIGVHLNETPVRVVREAFVGGCREPLHSLIVEAEVEDGVHHAGHGRACTRSDRHEQRLFRIAEFFPNGFLDAREVFLDRFFQLGRILFPVGVEVRADLSGDREARRNGNADVRHLGEACPFAAQDVLHLRVALGVTLAEEIDVLLRHRGRDYLRISRSTVLYSARIDSVTGSCRGLSLPAAIQTSPDFRQGSHARSAAS